ncbi:hypothetical protein SRHO_G00199280 [Serrasalmus rhombeus]
MRKSLQKLPAFLLFSCHVVASHRRAYKEELPSLTAEFNCGASVERSSSESEQTALTVHHHTVHQEPLMEPDYRDTFTAGIRCFLCAVTQLFTCCCWVGSDECKVIIPVEETSPASLNQSSVRPWFVEEETSWYPNVVPNVTLP